MAAEAEDRGYAYDPAWNLRNRTNNGVNQNFYVNGKNELINYTYGGFCTYDANGNLTNRVNGTWQYGYDDENQLVQMTNYSGSTPVTWTRLVYDGRLRLRVRQEYTYSAQATNPGPESLTLGLGGRGATALARPGGGSSPWQLASETRYLYDGMRVIQERDGNNVPVVSYTRGTDLGGSLEGAGGIGGLLARSHGYSGGSWTTHNDYHADGNGNVTYLVDSSQGLAASYRYDAYGNTLAASGSLAMANAYRFSSKEVHVLTGLYYYGYRWYAPDLQRWVNRDPVEEAGGVNLYGFVFNVPNDNIDAFGLEKVCGDWSPVVWTYTRGGNQSRFDHNTERQFRGYQSQARGIWIPVGMTPAKRIYIFVMGVDRWKVFVYQEVTESYRVDHLRATQTKTCCNNGLISTETRTFEEDQFHHLGYKSIPREVREYLGWFPGGGF